MNDKELNALISLLEDPDKEVFDSVKSRLVELGIEVLPELENAWESNFGYGTKAHMEGLKKFGITSHHRKGFKPIHKMLSS